MSLHLLPPKDRVQEIAYQTILPYYSVDILEEYEKVQPGIGSQLNSILQKEISHLYQSKEKWKERIRINPGSSFIAHNWESHLASCGYRTSGYGYTAPEKK